ncbi:MAG: SRPBCC family protein [Planctomycetota bacterium]
MNALRTATIAGAMIASVQSTAIGQMNGQMPPRTAGPIQIDSVTAAPLQITRSVELDAAPGDVFDFVVDPASWPNLLGMIESVKVVGTGRVGSTREVTLSDGSMIVEEITSYTRPRGGEGGAYGYSIESGNPFGVEGHLGAIVVNPADGGGTVLQYHQYFDHPDLEGITPVIEAGTEEIVGGIVAQFGGELRGTTYGLSTVRIEQQRIIDASARKTWRVLGEQWPDVDKWSSVIAHSESKNWRRSSPVGATRSCEVPGTPGFRETLLTYDEDGRSLSYRVDAGVPPFVTRAVNTWTIEPLADERVVLRSVVELDVAPGTPSVAIGMTKGQFTQLIEPTVDELVHYVETGRKHPRTVAAGRRRP